MFDIFQKGGILMYFILLSSLIGAVIIIERLIYFRRIQVDEETLIRRLKTALQKGHHDEAMSICEQNPSPISNLMKVGIEYRHRSKQEIRDAILDAASLETPKLERSIPALGTIGYLAPLLGLLGTVTGNIRAFQVLGQFGSVGDPGLLARGIAEALLTTAAGLIVAIPIVIFYNYLVTRVNHMILRMENRVNELVLLLEGSEHAL
jgi:biopolymer transport protein ExbB